MSRPPLRERDTLLTAIVAVLTIATLYFAREILIPIALAVLLAFVLAPLAQLLNVRIWAESSPLFSWFFWQLL